MIKFTFFLLVFLTTSAHSVTGSLFNAMMAKSLVEVKNSELLNAKETIKIPLSKGLDQGMSELCWAFSTSSFLEMHYLYENPNSQNILLSRAFMQRNNAQERALRTYILKTDTFMERGTFMNALQIIKKYGVMPFDTQPLAENYAGPIKKQLESYATAEEQNQNLEAIVDKLFFRAPTTVTFDGQPLTPSTLAALLVDQEFMSFAFKKGATGAFDKHPDTDSLTGIKSWYVDPSEKEAIIKKSLLAGYPLEMSFSAHSVLLFGADYGDDGKAIKYYIKDSYVHGSGFTYEADAKALHNLLWELGTIDVR